MTLPSHDQQENPKVLSEAATAGCRRFEDAVLREHMGKRRYTIELKRFTIEQTDREIIRVYGALPHG